MKSSTLSITFAAMMMVAAFAGIMLVADDVNAGDSGSSDESSTSSSWASDGKGDYSVTFAFDGGVIVKQMSTGNKYNFSGADAVSISGTVKAPAGYEFSAWKDSSSGVVYDGTSAYTFTQDIVVEPTFKVSASIVKLVYGDVEMEFTAGNTDAYPISQKDMESFAKAIGATAKSDIQSSDSTTILSMDGYEFKGFFAESDADYKTVIAFNGLEGTTTASITTFVAVFTPIYNLDFYVDGTITSSIKSNGYSLENQPMDPVKANYTFKGWAVDGEIVSVIEAGKIVITQDYVESLEEDTDFVAVFEPVQLTMTFIVGEFIHTQPALYGQVFAAPALPSGYACWATMELVDDVEAYTEFDFSQPIYEDTVLYAQAVDPSAIYNVTFEIEGKAAVIQKSDSIVIPNPSVDGKVFKGWVVKGESNYVDPSSYEYTADVTFVAIYDKAPAPAGPGFFQTTAGQCTAVIIAVLIIALVYAVYTNMFGMKDFLTSFKVQRVKK